MQVWDRLIAAGASDGITPGGYRALESLRLEKGYRYFGTDLTAADTPYESGLGFCVALDKGEFNGRAALSEPRRRRRRGGCGRSPSAAEEYLTVYGGEAVRLDGRVVGRVRSCGYGYTVGETIALATVPAELEEGTELTVDVFGGTVRGRACERDVAVRPGGDRIRG